MVAITGFSPGGTMTIADLRGMAIKIADLYHRNGYFVAQAYLPAQDIKDGTVSDRRDRGPLRQHHRAQ